MAGNRYDSALAKGFPENEREELSETKRVGRLLEDMLEEVEEEVVVVVVSARVLDVLDVFTRQAS